MVWNKVYIFANETLRRLGIGVAISGNRCLTVREGMKLIQEDGSGGFDSHVPDEV